MSSARFEMRLVGGYRMWWSTITPIVAGRLQVLGSPEFYRATDLRPHADEAMAGLWDLWPIDNPARPHPLQETDRLTRKVQITTRTLGVALISLQRDDDRRSDWLWVELFLSQNEAAQNGRTVCEDWAHVLRSSKDDERKEAVLGLNLKDITLEEVAGFRSQKKLVTSDLTLEVRSHS